MVNPIEKRGRREWFEITENGKLVLLVLDEIFEFMQLIICL